MENQEENITRARGKLWEKIDELYSEVKHKDRKEAVAKFRQMSRHDSLAHHLHRIHVYQSDKCVLCNDPDLIMGKHHLLVCPTLNPTAQHSKDVARLYWETREKMT